MKNIMYYDKPAENWADGLPVGNGRIGTMVTGNCQKEILSLNEDTLWSGYPRDYTDENAFSYLENARTAVFEKRYKDAEEILNRHMTGVWTESYLPMADLVLEIEREKAEISHYERTLDLSQGVCSTSFRLDGAQCTRTVFCSYPDQVLVVRFCAEAPLDLKISLTSQLRGWNETEESGLFYHGWCPEEVEPSYYECKDPIRYREFEETRGIRFMAGVKAVALDGTVETSEGFLRIAGCRDCVLLVSSANSFGGYQNAADREYENRLNLCLEQAAKKEFGELLRRHVQDHGSLFEKVELDLGHTDREKLPMGERLKRFQSLSEDPELVATAFQFGRYLTIASSREGTQPGNLQGIWNRELRAPWSSNYTVNINTEMNYWPAEKCNLSACSEPMLKFIRECAESGRKTAKVNYHCRGWCVHHNVDLWRKTTAVGPRKKGQNVQPWSFWLAGGGWLCRHLWEHYLYTRDEAFLREDAYPISMDCASFYLDFLVEKDGRLVTCPSTSPENMFMENGVLTGVTYGTAMDMEVIEELFRHCMEMAKQLGITPMEDERLREIHAALPRLLERKAGKCGQLLEWAEDYEEHEENHRHLSHLYGLYPSDLFTKYYGGDDKLMGACRISLERRGNDGVPWSRAWKIALQARLGEGEEAGAEIVRYLQLADSVDAREISYTNGGIYENLFAARPLQIDGCFGFTAAVAEMLVQDENGEIKLLPAIPKAWKTGYVKGLRLRSGQCVEIRWNEEKCESLFF